MNNLMKDELPHLHGISVDICLACLYLGEYVVSEENEAVRCDKKLPIDFYTITRIDDDVMMSEDERTFISESDR